MRSLDTTDRRQQTVWMHDLQGKCHCIIFEEECWYYEWCCTVWCPPSTGTSTIPPLKRDLFQGWGAQVTPSKPHARRCFLHSLLLISRKQQLHCTRSNAFNRVLSQWGQLAHEGMACMSDNGWSRKVRLRVWWNVFVNRNTPMVAYMRPPQLLASWLLNNFSKYCRVSHLNKARRINELSRGSDLGYKILMGFGFGLP